MPEARPSSRGRSLSVPGVFCGMTLGLFLMRFFIVAESAGQGETLWIAGLWILACLVFCLFSNGFPTARFGKLDLSVALLVCGHIVAALVVVATAGEKRTAVNLGWEWVGLGAGWFLLRQCCRQQEFRQELLAGILASGAAIAGFGLYQHYVELPQLVARYGPLFDRLKQGGNPVELAQIRKELAELQIPIEGPALTLFEKRLRDSREPQGLFALANTLGGFLAVGLILTVVTAAAHRHAKVGSGRAWWLTWIPLVVIIGWCLLLTKSRTAWIGTAVGLSVWSLGMGGVRISNRWLSRAALGLVALVFLGWGLTKVGGLDRQVLTEAPKSLQYRLQYWAATWPMIASHPWFGVGPGQFRSYYLQYKLPEASEEIADPHNIFLDVAASGGILALVGLFGCGLLLAQQLRTSSVPAEPSPNRDLRAGIAYGLGCVVVVNWCLLLLSKMDDRLLALVPITFALYLMLRRISLTEQAQQSSLRIGFIVAAIALVTHLCGAGGIEMPAIAQLLFALAAWSDWPTNHSIQFEPSNRSVKGVFAAGVCACLLAGIYFTALRPVKLAEEKIEVGDKLVMRGLRSEADQNYAEAANDDPFTLAPWQRRAELAWQMTQEKRFRSEETFASAIHLMEEAQRRDPLNPHHDQRLGQWWIARWQVTQNEQDALAAVAALEQAWRRYPTNGQLMSELAFAYQAAGKSELGRQLAQRALAQDRINHDRGHEDRYLSEAILKNLSKLADPQE